jgi:hypothetical protein
METVHPFKTMGRELFIITAVRTSDFMIVNIDWLMVPPGIWSV